MTITTKTNNKAKAKIKNVSKSKGNAKTSLDRPGPLQSDDEVLTYNTHQTIMLVKGRQGKQADKVGPKKHPIMGLMSFASGLSPIHDAAKADDPFADFYLLEIELRLKTIKAELIIHERELKELAKSTSSSIELLAAHSNKPATFAARFKSPYAFGAAYLLQDLDNYIFHLLALHQRMIINQKELMSKMASAMKPFRSMFTLVRDFKSFGLTRHDFSLQTAVAMNAKSHYASVSRPVILSDSVIDRSERAEFAPQINAMFLTPDDSVGGVDMGDIGI